MIGMNKTIPNVLKLKMPLLNQIRLFGWIVTTTCLIWQNWYVVF